MEAKHAKAERYVANVPGDAYYREQINTLQRKLNSAQTEVELKGDYIEELEKKNMELIERVNHLRNALASMIEEKYSNV